MDILIKNVSEAIASALNEKARAEGKDRMTYIHDLLIKIASEPLIKQRYAIKIGTTGYIRRFGDDLTSNPYEGCTEEEAKIIEQATDLVRRNGIGDHEEAIWLLKNHFNDVYEVAL